MYNKHSKLDIEGDPEAFATAKETGDRPLTERELKVVASLNVWVMDCDAEGDILPAWIADGIPRDATPALARKGIRWFNSTASGNY